MAPPIGTDLVPRASVADRSRFDANIILDGCPVRTASIGVRSQSSHCTDRLLRARVTDSFHSVASITGLVRRERPSSGQLLQEAWRAPGLDGRIACWPVYRYPDNFFDICLAQRVRENRNVT